MKIVAENCVDICVRRKCLELSVLVYVLHLCNKILWLELRLPTQVVAC
jgi:hypothetical protein